MDRSARMEDRRREILVTVRQVVMDRGLKQSTMGEIAEEASISRSMLYNYFRNKSELQGNLSWPMLQVLVSRIRRLGRETRLSPARRIARLQAIMVDIYLFDPLLLIHHFQMQSSGTLDKLSADLTARIGELTHSALESIALIFEEGIRRGEFIDRPPRLLAEIAWALLTGVVLHEGGKSGEAERSIRLEESLGSALNIFLRGIRRGPAATGGTLPATRSAPLRGGGRGR